MHTKKVARHKLGWMLAFFFKMSLAVLNRYDTHFVGRKNGVHGVGSSIKGFFLLQKLGQLGTYSLSALVVMLVSRDPA